VSEGLLYEKHVLHNRLKFLRHYEYVIVPPYKDPRAKRVRHHDDEAEFSDTNSEKQNYRRKSDKNESAKKEASVSLN
jgi:hypothetical protein